MLRKRMVSSFGLLALIGMTGCCCPWWQRHCCQPATCCQPASSPCCAPAAPTPVYGPAAYQPGYPAVTTQLQQPIPAAGIYNNNCCQ